MVFASTEFLFRFLPVALLLYYVAPKRHRNGVLAGLSFWFYAHTGAWFCLLMLATCAVDFGCGRVIAPVDGSQPALRTRRMALAISLATDLTLLAIFKYLGLLTRSLDAVFAAAAGGQFPIVELALPVGISFYTFQSMSYTIDLYRGQTTPARSFVDYACFVSFFAQLVAGPIVRHRQLNAQLHERIETANLFAVGVAFFACGLAKKVLLADPVGDIADAAFGARSLGTAQAWHGLLAYSLQIYLDFSGYSDMAVGLGLFFGFRLPRNFNYPYLADGPRDFWRRWHLTLSTWFRDYLYIPLGGNRLGPRRTAFNLTVVMLLCGLWHGASWNFLVWGAIHGVVIAADRARAEREWLTPGCRRLLTFLFVTVAWVPFRAADLPAAIRYLGSLCRFEPANALLAAELNRSYNHLALAAAAIVVWRLPDTWEFCERLDRRTLTALLLLAAALVGVILREPNAFIYFQF